MQPRRPGPAMPQPLRGPLADVKDDGCVDIAKCDFVWGPMGKVLDGRVWEFLMRSSCCFSATNKYEINSKY